MKTQKSFFERNCGTYTQVGDVLLPNLVIEEAEQTQAHRPIGKYGRMRNRYLNEHCPTLYSNMLLAGKLFPHLLKIDEACEDQAGKRDRGAQSHRSDEMGSTDEQHSHPCRRDRAP